MPPQFMLCRRHHVFALTVAAYVPSSVHPVLNIFLSLHRNAEQI